jgi:4-amino-4-deoxy-L-arabinose transferase-like glycosyltransferase
MSDRLRGLRRFCASPLGLILLGTLAVRMFGIGWGLPASDAWEEDGIAPRDFLVGTYETFLPGQYFTYPPVHLITLSILTAPAWGWTLLHARSFAQADVVSAMTQVPTMTILTVVARLVSELMAVGIVFSLAKIAEEIRGPRAALLVALTCGLNAILTYYAHTSNLDVPYIFWASLGLLECVRAIARGEPRRMRRALLLAALAVGTKDQAYALFLLAGPIAITLWMTLDPAARQRRREIAREVLVGTAVAVGALLLVDGAVTNPFGFRRRISFLLGPASADHAFYARSWGGRWKILEDLAHSFRDFFPWPFALLVVVGLVDHVLRSRRTPAKLVAGLVPVLAAVSFVVCFNFTARRTEHRFALPVMIFVSMYAGLAFDALLELCRTRATRALAIAAIAGPLAWALFRCAAIDANLILDPRYEAEAWLSAEAKPGDTIEVYGGNPYLPRFPSHARVSRVDITPLAGRSPLPGITEVEGRFEDVEARRPRFVIVPDAWIWRYNEGVTPDGRVVPPLQAERLKDLSARGYFRGLTEGSGAYRLIHVSAWSSTVFPPADIHSSTARAIRIFERKP